MFFSETENGRFGSNSWLLLGFLLCFAIAPSASQNLVPNPGFELNDTCPYTFGFQGNSKPLNWNGWNQSPDYFHSCAGSLGGVDTLISVPLNGFGFQYPMHGEAYVGMYAYGATGGNVDYREFLGCQLIEALVVGETYEMSCYTNVAFGGNYWAPTWACNNMGMLFTMEPNVWTGVNQPPFNARNYAHLNSSIVNSDTVDWRLVSGSFVADSAYQYLVIGNFFSNALTDTFHIVPGNSLGAYYFVDGVCVRRSGQPCEFLTTVPEIEEIGTYVWPNPSSNRISVNVDVGTEWQVYDVMGRLLGAGVSTSTILGIPVQQLANGEYVLKLGSMNRRQVRFVVMK